MEQITYQSPLCLGTRPSPNNAMLTFMSTNNYLEVDAGALE